MIGQRIKDASRIVLACLGRPDPAKRKRLSYKHIRGAGIEVGALHNPLPVAQGVRVTYLDRLTREEARARYPGLGAASVLDPDILDDGFTLGAVRDCSQDFLIANHVLEHSPDPVGTMLHWGRVVKPAGILFVSVPLIDRCFDRGRELTSLDHMLEDHRLHAAAQAVPLARRNRRHYEEWVAVSDRNIYRDLGQDYPLSSAEDIARHTDALSAEGREIHFHTFTKSSLKELLAYFGEKTDCSLQLRRLATNDNEAIAILRKT